jgi:hypothetical protein
MKLEEVKGLTHYEDEILGAAIITATLFFFLTSLFL